MNPAPNPFATRILSGPSDTPDCHSLEIEEAEANGMQCMCSAWEPTEDELAAINRGEKIWLHIYAQRHPMVSLSAGERPFHHE